jgi:hypothetical protein
MKTMSGFCEMGDTVKADWVGHFQGFTRAILMQTSLKIT